MKAALFLLVLLLAPPAGADTQPHANATHHFTVNPPASFVFHQGPEHLGSYSEPGLVLSLSRIDYPNLPARWRNDKDRFFKQVADGVRKASKGRLKRQSLRTIKRVPVLDTQFVRKGGKERVWMRFLFHRRFAIVASAATPIRGKKKSAAQAFVKSLEPLPSE